MLRKEITDGTFATVDMLHQRFLVMPRNSPLPPKVEEVEQEAGSSDDDEEEEEDEEMGDAPTPATEPRERLERVVDEDGFELVQKGRRK
jgi:pre-rRNA-processing protein TSR2